MSGFSFTAASMASNFNQNYGEDVVAYNNGTTSNQNAWNWNNLPDLLGNITGGAADIIGSMNGNPDNVTYINGDPQTNNNTQKKSNLPWILLGTLVLFIVGGIVIYKIKK